MAAVINRAMADLEKANTAMKTSLAVKDEAMAWINSPECEAFCDALDMNYTIVREKAAALYRRFLEEAGGREKALRKPGARSGKAPDVPRLLNNPLYFSQRP
jgi:hypothetical protein